MMGHALWVLFVWVLGNQAGVPVPDVPALLAAGALAGRSSLGFTVVLTLVVGATLCADLAWYSVGRWRGAQVLGALHRLLRRPKMRGDRVRGLYRAHHFGFLVSARFLPELNPVAAGLAGAMRVRLTRYLLCSAGSALVWAGTWAGLGCLVGGTIVEGAARLDIARPVLIAGTLAAATVSGLVLVSSQGIVNVARCARSAGAIPRPGSGPPPEVPGPREAAQGQDRPGATSAAISGQGPGEPHALRRKHHHVEGSCPRLRAA
jgi:membrane protein DedA with SNARE-associated domain